MSGEIFQPMDNLEDIDVVKRNPLLCYLCNEPYDDPCILSCFHTFCMRCLRGRAKESQMLCPLCGAATHLKDGQSLPPPDPLLKFMVESSLDEKASCANCDKDCSSMYFCNTCSQPLCKTCRDDTHGAKMFAAHDIVVLSKRTKEIHKRCALHKEPYIMFSAEKKIMLCINCFRDMRIESRTHCVDLETAYNQSCRKLELSVQAIRDLQNSVKDGILLLRALLEEIKHNAKKEGEAISTLYDSLQEKIKLTMESLSVEADSQYKAKETSFKAQLTGLTTLLPTIHVHLVTSAAFVSSANKFEFLDMSYVMMERLKAIVHQQHPLHPTQGSQVDTDFKNKFAKSLEPLLYEGPGKAVLPTSPVVPRRATAASSINRIEMPKLAQAKSGQSTSRNAPTRPTTNNGRRNGIGKVKFIDAKGVFADHCVEFESSHRDVLQKLERLKSQVQELQRDLTLRRCLARPISIDDLRDNIAGVESQLEKHYDYVEEKQPVLEKHWEESVQRIANEQELYQAQCQDVLRLKQEAASLNVITAQLTSFISSITSVVQRLAPKLGQSSSDAEHDSQLHALLDEINSVHPDSQQRVDAIQTVEEVRQVNMANRKNLLDDELIKTKGLLRAASLRQESSSKRDNSSPQSPSNKEEQEVDCDVGPDREAVMADMDEQLIKTKALLRAPSLRLESSSKRDNSASQTPASKQEQKANKVGDGDISVTENVKTDEVKTDEVKTDEVKTEDIKTEKVKTDIVKTVKKDSVKTEKARTNDVKADKVKADKMQTDHVKIENVKTDNMKTEKLKADCVKTEKVKTDKMQTDNVKTNNMKTDNIKTDKMPTDNVKTDMKTEKVKSDNVKTEKVKTENVKTEKVKVEKVKTDKVKTDKLKTDKLKMDKLKEDTLFTETIVKD